MSDIKVSIAMACFNSGKFLRDAIKSIVKQTYKNWELIVIDDCSTDKSMGIIERIVKKSSIENKIKVFKHDKNYGYGKTLKDAIENGTGELIAIVDSDDAITRCALRIMVNMHEKHPEASLVYSNYYVCDKDLFPQKLGPSRSLKSYESYINTKIRISHLKCLKRKFYNMTEGVNPNLLKTVDKDLTLKLEEVGKLIYVNKPLYFYRRHQGNISCSFGRKSKAYKEMVWQMTKQIYIDAKRRRGLI